MLVAAIIPACLLVGLFFVERRVIRMRRIAIKGTPLRYITTTWLIAINVVEMLSCLLIVVLAVLGGDGLSAIVWGINFLACVFNLWLLLQSDEDNWFNDQWKKAKRWVRSLRTPRRRRLSPVSVH